VKDRIREIVDRGRKVIVVSHIDPDGDAVGTELAFGAYLADLGKEVHLALDSQVPEKYLFLQGVERIMRVDSLPADFTADTAIVLECPSRDRLGRATRLLGRDTVVVSIDHHRGSTEFGDVNWVDIEASSVGEMVYEYFRHVGYRPNAGVAEQLYTAVLTDTGRFRYASTSARTMAIAGELIAAGADPRRVCDHVYYNLQPSTMKLMGKVLNGIEFLGDGRICLMTMTNDMVRQAGALHSESDGLVDYTLFNQGVQIGALLKEVDAAHTKVSLRSNNGVDVAAIAAVYGGGGHFNAAGCTIPLPLGNAKAELVRRLSEANDDAQ